LQKIVRPVLPAKVEKVEKDAAFELIQTQVKVSKNRSDDESEKSD